MCDAFQAHIDRGRGEDLSVLECPFSQRQVACCSGLHRTCGSLNDQLTAHVTPLSIDTHEASWAKTNAKLLIYSIHMNWTHRVFVRGEGEA